MCHVSSLLTGWQAGGGYCGQERLNSNSRVAFDHQIVIIIIKIVFGCRNMKLEEEEDDNDNKEEKEEDDNNNEEVEVEVEDNNNNKEEEDKDVGWFVGQ